MKNNLAAHLARVGAALFATLIPLSAIGVASTPQTIYTFPSNGSDGFPSGGLVFDSAGNLYGTTEDGGTSNYGTVFELSQGPNGVWTETVLYSFKGPRNNQDGEYPQTGVIIDGAGNLYGTTTVGRHNRNMPGWMWDRIQALPGRPRRVDGECHLPILWHKREIPLRFSQGCGWHVVRDHIGWRQLRSRHGFPVETESKRDMERDSPS